MVAFPKSSLLLSLAALVGLAWTAGHASALDYTDVRNLMQNQVQESVIINMIHQAGPIAVSEDQANELRALGASENLIGSLQTYTASVPQSTVTYVEPPMDTTVYASPTTTYVEPPVVADSTIYVDPGVTYYDPSAPVVIYDSSPTYVYPSYPAYRYGPSFGFSIGIGNSRRHHRPSRPSGGHRPGRPGRPGGSGRPHRR